MASTLTEKIDKRIENLYAELDEHVSFCAICSAENAPQPVLCSEAADKTRLIEAADFIKDRYATKEIGS